MNTVFDFRYNIDASEIGLFRALLIGSVVVFVADFVLLLRKKSQGHRSIFSKLAVKLLIVSLIGLVISTPVVLFDKIKARELFDAYEQNLVEVVEGVVSVIHEQPKTGHDKGDIISVDGKQFEINYFVATRGYKQTIAHGGVLKDGTSVKLYHYDGAILRIDVAGNTKAGK